MLNLDCCVVSVSKAGTVADCFWPSVVSCRTAIPARRVRGRIRWLGGRGGWAKSQGQAFGQWGAPFHSWRAAGCHPRTCCSRCNHFPSAGKVKRKRAVSADIQGKNGSSSSRKKDSGPENCSVWDPAKPTMLAHPQEEILSSVLFQLFTSESVFYDVPVIGTNTAMCSALDRPIWQD